MPNIPPATGSTIRRSELSEEEHWASFPPAESLSETVTVSNQSWWVDADGSRRQVADWELEDPQDTPDLMDSAPIEYRTES